MNPKNMPNRPGFFFARQRGIQYWNLIAQIYGEGYFLRCDTWNYNSMETHEDIDVADIEEFGPEILMPKIEEWREDWKA